ncbi:MAG: type II secretion system F family protein, partial [Desulfosarcinaceae bacterium]
MPNFRYKAVNDEGRVFKGTAIATDEGDVERYLSESGLSLIRSTAVKESTLAAFTGNRVKARALIEFYHRFAQTLEIGLPILSALEENAHHLPSKSIRRISAEIRMAVQGGKTLYEAMSAHPKVFKKLDLAIIGMGERSGVLPECLKKMAAFLEWKDELQSHVKKATIYPAFVILAIVAVIGVWIGYVLPRMVTVLLEMDVAIPRATIAVLNTSRFVTTYWPWFVLALLVIPLAFYAFQKTRRGSLVFHRHILKVPLLGPILANIALTRLSQNFAIMFNAGMPIQQIFSTLADNALGNRYLEDRLRFAYQEIEGGVSIAAAFKSAGGFPSLLLGAIRNGEETGTLDQAFKRLGDYFDKEVKRTVQALL